MNLQKMSLGILLAGLVSGSLWAQASPLEGQWRAVNGLMYGQEVPQSALQSMTLSITGTSFTAVSGNLTSTGNLNVRGDQVQFSITTGADAGRTLYAKFRAEGTRMTIVYSDQAAPTDFNSNATNRYLSMIYDNGAQQVTGAAGITTEQGTGGGAAIQ